MPQLDIGQDEANEHLALLRKLHSRMVAANDTNGEAEIMELIDVFKSATLKELTVPSKIQERNESPAPEIQQLFDVVEPEYPDDFDTTVASEADGSEVYRVRLDKGPEHPLGFGLAATQGGVLVKDVFPGTSDALEGNLVAGDRVVAVGTTVVGKGPDAHKDAVAALQGSTGVIDLWMARRPPSVADSPLSEGGYWRHLESVSLSRANASDDLGFTIRPGPDPNDVIVASIAPGGLAYQDGRIQVDDRILEINKKTVTKMSFHQVQQLLNDSGTDVNVKIARLVTGQDPMAELMRKEADGEVTSEIITVELEKGNTGLGLTIAAYVGTGDVQGIFVKHVIPGSSAADCDVHPLDQIVEVDGQSLVDKSNGQSLKLLKATQRKTLLKLKRRLRIPAGLHPVRESPSDEELIAKWQPRILPWEKVLVVRLEKDPDTGGLGMGIEGRGEGENSQRTHVVCMINPEGAVARSGLLQDGDRLLETGCNDLTACDHDQAVDFLRQAPPKFRLVIARPEKEATGSEVATVAAAAAVAAAATPTPTPEAASPNKKVRSPVQAWHEPRDVTLTKDETGRLGFSILDYMHPDNEDELIVLIRAVVPKSVAYGVLRENQKLLHVNGKDLKGMSLDQALPILKDQPQGKVYLRIADPVETQSESSSTVETTDSQTISVPVDYADMELGLDVDVERGRDGVLVKAVLRNGMIAKDGRLAVGDRLVAVNHVKLEHTSPSLARAALRNASRSESHMLVTFVPGPRHGIAVGDVSSSGEGAAAIAATGVAASAAGKGGLSASSSKSNTSSPRLPRLSVYSDPITVEVPRMPSGGLGISIVGGNTEIEDEDGTMTRVKGIFIKHVLPDSPAGASSQLKSGDRLLKVGEVSLENASHQEAVEAIRAASNPVTLVLQTLPATVRESRKERLKREEQERLDAANQDANSEQTATLAAAQEKYKETFPGYEFKLVELLKGDQGLGLGLASEGGNIVVGDIREGSNAVGKLEINDVLVDVNGTETLHLSHAQLSEFMRNAPAKMVTIIARKPKPVTPSASPAINRAPVAKLKLTTDELREVTLVKPASGSLGMAISKHRTDEKILFIKSITAGSVTSQNARIRRGDHVLEINGQSTLELTYAQAIGLLKEAKGEVKLVLGTLPPGLLLSPPTSPAPSSSSGPSMEELQTIELVKPTGRGLGISIVERANPTVEGKRAIFVADVVMDGVAYKDGRLKAGSRIMSVNGVDMSEAVQSQAVTAMKSAQGTVVLVVQPSSGSAAVSAATSPVKPTPAAAESAAKKPPPMGALRSLTLDQTQREGVEREEGDEPRRVVIQRKAGQSLGMSIAGGVGSAAGDVPIFIAGVQPEGPAAATKNIQVGDRVLEVNNEKVLAMTREQVVNLLRASAEEVVMLVVRDTSLTTIDPGKTSQKIAQQDRRESEFRTVTLLKSDAGYGFSIVGGRDEGGTDFPIYIKEVVSGGAADTNGQLHRGDQLVAINSHNLEGKSCKETSLLIVESIKEELTLTVLS
eukprot:scpid12690/ scgid32153/ Multiple PDZ domain protein; Multi-PDZ domain protein 1